MRIFMLVLYVSLCIVSFLAMFQTQRHLSELKEYNAYKTGYNECETLYKTFIISEVSFIARLSCIHTYVKLRPECNENGKCFSKVLKTCFSEGLAAEESISKS